MRSIPVADRFWPKVEKTDDCWDWVAGKAKEGYGAFRVGSSMKPAHRVSYELLIGPIPENMTLDHLCRNRACVNPEHLEPVTREENVRRAQIGVPGTRKEKCNQGHLLSGDNLYSKNGRRNCRACQRDRQRRYRDKNQAQASVTPFVLFGTGISLP